MADQVTEAREVREEDAFDVEDRLAGLTGRDPRWPRTNTQN